jgi:hypothetical protein
MYGAWQVKGIGFLREVVFRQSSICFEALLTIVLFAPGYLSSQENMEIGQTPGTDIVWFKTAKGGSHQLEIDDADGFRTPVVTKSFIGTKLDLHINDAGLIPGLVYHLRIDGKRDARDLRLAPIATLDLQASCATVRHTWETTVRSTVGAALSGLQWAGNHWIVAPHSYLLGESLYNSEILMRSAVVAARACGDMQTLDEIAQYYVIMLRQTETVGELLKRPRVTSETKVRLRTSDPLVRTFSTSFGVEAGERELFNTQWLYPSALLLRIVTIIPEASRTPAMKSFANQYTQFILKDQLERYLFHEHLSPQGGAGVEGRVASWEASMRAMKGIGKWDTAMSDVDLWLLASTAEILGAHSNDPRLVPIDEHHLAQLHLAMQTGIRFFQTKRTEYRETRNFKGDIVGSASYFNGDYATVSDNEFSAVEGEKMPTAAEQRANPNVSWDISHIYRLPVFLRALYENRKAFGFEYPRYKDLQLVINQYMYKVFTGNYSRPQFRNFFDGSDGWFRVSYNGAGFGHPPSDFCDMRNPLRPCLTPGAITGWPELAFANADLARLENSLVKLAFVKEPAIAEFRDRHYSWNGSYKMDRVNGANVYDGALYLVIAENAAMISSVNSDQ